MASKGGGDDSGWSYDPKKIRNFSIIAHIDHGKSTLADRLLESTKTVASRDMQQQLLDNLSIERDRGITIKLQAARILYTAKDGETYLLNLIDTPGHVDFGYEVSRSLAACEGALLVVDAAQGVEAQTMANVYLALENNLEIIPVVNKIDLPAADPDAVCEEVEATIGLDTSNHVRCSAKTGVGIEDILEAIVEIVPHPAADKEKDLRALIFDSYYDAYRGVVVFFRVVDGEVRKGDKVHFMNSGKEYEVLEVGVMTPTQVKVDVLRAGEVGFLSAAIKEVDDARVGDTITLASTFQKVEELPGYMPAKQMVFAGLYPSESDDYEKLRDAIGKLKLNDAALSYQPEVSSAMGYGFRCGFLGLLHMDIVQERLEREYDIDLIVTAPSVVYRITDSKGVETLIDSPAKLPDPTTFEEIAEPYVRLEMITPTEYTGPLMDLGQTRRGILVEIKYLTPTRTTIIYDLPLAEVITDFFDQVKTRTKGYASMSFSEIGFKPDKLVRLDIRINGEDAPPLATIVHRDRAHDVGKIVCKKLKEFIPRQQFKIPIQACVGAKPVASVHISAVMKDVLAKCYGGDISRKKKLLQKQAKGKKRMKAMGKVSVPQEAFQAVIRINDDFFGKVGR
jgi:GTP-binding protein LepA